jgi:hypothetical protein
LEVSVLKICYSPFQHNPSTVERFAPHLTGNAIFQKTLINTAEAPKGPLGIYTQSIVANGMVFPSGVVNLDQETMRIKNGDIKSNTLRNMPSYLSEARMRTCGGSYIM